MSKIPPLTQTVIYIHKTEVKIMTESQKLYWLLYSHENGVMVDGLRKQREMSFYYFMRLTNKEFWNKYGRLKTW